MLLKMGVKFQKNFSWPSYDLQSRGQGQMQGHYEHWRSYGGQEPFFGILPPFFDGKID